MSTISAIFRYLTELNLHISEKSGHLIIAIYPAVEQSLGRMNVGNLCSNTVVNMTFCWVHTVFRDPLQMFHYKYKYLESSFVLNWFFPLKNIKLSWYKWHLHLLISLLKNMQIFVIFSCRRQDVFYFTEKSILNVFALQVSTSHSLSCRLESDWFPD